MLEDMEENEHEPIMAQKHRNMSMGKKVSESLIKDLV